VIPNTLLVELPRKNAKPNFQKREMFKIFSIISREQRIGFTLTNTPTRFSNDKPKIDERFQPILGENRDST
jgi:hypothetical protein